MHINVPAYDQAQNRRTFLFIFLVSGFFFGAWALIFYQQKPRTADGEISRITVVPFHTEFRQGGTMAQGYGGSVQKEDELYVWVAMDMKNVTKKLPLFATKQRATLTLPDGEQQFANAAGPSDIAKLHTLPHMEQPEGTLLPHEFTVKPGQTAQGLLLFAFPITKQTWDTHRDFSVAISFQYQRDLALREPKPKL